MVKRKIVDTSPEDLSNLQRLVGAENVLAHCAGVNYQVYVTDTRLLVGKRFTTGEKFMNVPTASINTLELITKSLLPPLTFAVLGAIASFLIWWFPGTSMLPLPVFPYQDARSNWIARAGEGRFHTHRGYLDLKGLVGLEYGVFVKTSLGQSLAVFKPRLLELVNSFSRPTQIMYPKDIGYAIYQLGLKDGDTVIEVGTDSGALTGALAQAVAPNGRVYTYENREEFQRSAKKNVEKTGLSSQVTFRNIDPSQGFLELNADAAVIDLGDPWKMVAPAWEALAGGGMLAGFTPTVNQLEKLAEALRKGGFLVLEAVELLMREFKTETGKVRPESRMIGHTAYVTIARKVIVKE